MSTVEELNNTVWCKLAPSPIHGIGVFAIRDIPKGQKIYCRGMPNTEPIVLDKYTGLLPEIEQLIKQRWPLAFEGEIFQSPNNDARMISFMNHSKEPNYDKILDTTLREVKKGEEITEDYGLLDFNN